MIIFIIGVKNWQHVANCLPGRAANQCHARWRQESRANETKSGKWTDLEERKLVLAVLAYGEKNLSHLNETILNQNDTTNLNSSSSSNIKIKSGRDHKIWMKISKHVPGRYYYCNYNYYNLFKNNIFDIIEMK